MDRRPFVRAVLTRCRHSLEELGFEYLGRSWYEIMLTSETRGLVALPSTTYRDDPCVYVNPSIGVRHEALDKLISGLSGRSDSKYAAATISLALGYATAGKTFKSFVFCPGVDIEPIIKHLKVDISQDGMTWLREHADLETMGRDLRDLKNVTRDRARFNLPAALFLLGDLKGARSEIQRGLAELSNTENLYAEQYRTFAAAFLELPPLRS